jgi:hypothetical protein
MLETLYCCPNSGIVLFYTDSGFFDGKNRGFGRIGSKPFLWTSNKSLTASVRARMRTDDISRTPPHLKIPKQPQQAVGLSLPPFSGTRAPRRLVGQRFGKKGVKKPRYKFPAKPFCP